MENQYEFKGTKGEFHAVEFAGFFAMKEEPFYGAKDLLCYDDDLAVPVVTEEEAKANAYLFAAAPDLLSAAIRVVQSENPLQFHDHLGLLTEAIEKALTTPKP